MPGGEEPVIVRTSSGGTETAVVLLMDSAANMGWSTKETPTATTITIPKGAKWYIAEDLATGKLYLKRKGHVITHVYVDDMVEELDPTKEIPQKMIPKPGNDPEIEIYFSPK
jgi:hypothetical protein